VFTAEKLPNLALRSDSSTHVVNSVQSGTGKRGEGTKKGLLVAEPNGRLGNWWEVREMPPEKIAAAAGGNS
jgi:hypothetical protein